MIISSKDLFPKRARDDKYTETESSKVPLLFSPTNSPLSKKSHVGASTAALKSDSFTPLAIQGYDMGANPSTFVHLLDDMLLPQSMEAQSARPIAAILDDSAGYAFHVMFSLIFFLCQVCFMLYFLCTKNNNFSIVGFSECDGGP